MARLCLSIVVSFLLMAAFAPLKTAAAEDLSREQVEEIVRDYLLREPEIVYQALQELQRKQDQARVANAARAIEANKAALFDNPDDPKIGAEDPAVTVVEFFDYRCGFCRRMVPAITETLESQSDVRLVLKELPVLGPDSVRASRAALASRMQDEDLYGDFHFALLEADDLSEGGLVKIAEGIGLDGEQLLVDMDKEEIDQMIDANYALASALGIEGTPAFIIGDEFMPGAIDLNTMMQAIERQREKS
ncbi:MAG: DsbA family protein [Geminicoccaceae bacterium]